MTENRFDARNECVFDGKSGLKSIQSVVYRIFSAIPNAPPRAGGDRRVKRRTTGRFSAIGESAVDQRSISIQLRSGQSDDL